MKLTASADYAATPDQVWTMLLDPAFQERKCVATGALAHEVDIAEAGGGATITTRREMPTDEVPDFVRKLAGDRLDVLEVDHWGPAEADGSREGTVVVEIKGSPVRLTGTMRLAPEGSGTVHSVDGDLKASVPLIGGKIEKAAAPAILHAFEVENRVGTEYLSA